MPGTLAHFCENSQKTGVQFLFQENSLPSSYRKEQKSDRSLKATSAISPEVDLLFPLAVERRPWIISASYSRKDATLGVFVMNLRAQDSIGSAEENIYHTNQGATHRWVLNPINYWPAGM
jgi:hypothetical protein